ncbi:MAG: hypothetical protein HYU42_00070 [Candidatus Rokubacteria bacterium]|nr:hypothetical protein [Candidatus Rokubacteria bacterium]MBI3106819.1 hypothetical protein [Candidatus Rokubacteria bacterium]
MSLRLPLTTVDGLHTYDAFSPLVLFTLERVGFCGPGEAAAWVQDGRIELGGELANVVDVPPAEIRIDMAVSVVFDDVTPEISIPRFRRAP